MTLETMVGIVNESVSRYNLTARIDGNLIGVYDTKRRLAGTVTIDGVIDRKYIGSKVLMGSLVRDSIKTAIGGSK